MPSNTAEGYERNSPRDFVRFLNIAKGSIGELRTQLYIARELGYLEKEIFEDLLERSKEISAMLAGLIKEELCFVQEAFESNYIAPLGPMVDAFEKEFAEKVGLPHVVAASSGTAAVHVASEFRHSGIVNCKRNIA